MQYVQMYCNLLEYSGSVNSVIKLIIFTRHFTIIIHNNGVDRKQFVHNFAHSSIFQRTFSSFHFYSMSLFFQSLCTSGCQTCISLNSFSLLFLQFTLTVIFLREFQLFHILIRRLYFIYFILFLYLRGRFIASSFATYISNRFNRQRF